MTTEEHPPEAGSRPARERSSLHRSRHVLGIAARMPAGTPVKLLWSREDDVKNAWLRPATVHRLEARLDAEGNVTHAEAIAAVPPIRAFSFVALEVSPRWRFRNRGRTYPSL